MFDVIELDGAINRSVDRKELDEDQYRGYWAELAAFHFLARDSANGGPWGTYFQPMAVMGTRQDGTPACAPEIADATPETIEYWAARAKTVKHPVLAARYADLVWDFCKRVTGKAAGIEFARQAIDSYIDALNRDNGEAWGDNYHNVKRVLSLAQSIGDDARVKRAIDAIIQYADRTSQDEKLGTYCYLFKLLILPKNPPPLENEQRRRIIEQFEARFIRMIESEMYEVVPHLPQTIGQLLAEYYKREDREDDRRRILAEIARTNERRAGIGDALSGMHFLDTARQFYTEAGEKDEAARVTRLAQELAPKVKGEMSQHKLEFEITYDQKQRHLDALIANGLSRGLLDWTFLYLPILADVKKQKEDNDTQYPIQALFPSTIIGDEGITAKVNDTQGDPDGPMVFEIARHIQFSTIFMQWGLDHLFQNGLDAHAFTEFISQSPVFEPSRLALIRRGIQAHISGDYTEAIHLLIPQIERALVELIHKVGGSSKKPHRTGRGVMQSKSLNDALADDRVRSVLGEDLTMYLTATLSHPKGMNIRNDVCHGLLEPEAFTKSMSERVLHTLAALSLVRKEPDDPSASPTDAPRTDAPRSGEHDKPDTGSSQNEVVP